MRDLLAPGSFAGTDVVDASGQLITKTPTEVTAALAPYFCSFCYFRGSIWPFPYEADFPSRPPGRYACRCRAGAAPPCAGPPGPGRSGRAAPRPGRGPARRCRTQRHVVRRPGAALAAGAPAGRHSIRRAWRLPASFRQPPRPISSVCSSSSSSILLSSCRHCKPLAPWCRLLPTFDFSGRHGVASNPVLFPNVFSDYDSFLALAQQLEDLGARLYLTHISSITYDLRSDRGAAAHAARRGPARGPRSRPAAWPGCRRQELAQRRRCAPLCAPPPPRP